jgi:hypothetical protein
MRDRTSSSRSDEPQSDVVFTPDPAMEEAVAKGDAPDEEPAPPAQEARPVSREDDIGSGLNLLVSELSRLKRAYGEDTAILIGERAITMMRKATTP